MFRSYFRLQKRDDFFHFCGAVFKRCLTEVLEKFEKTGFFTVHEIFKNAFDGRGAVRLLMGLF